MHWEMSLAIEIALTVAAVWLGHSWACTLVAIVRTAVVVLASIAG